MVSTDPMNMHLLLVIFAWVSQNYRFPCRAISQKVCGSYKQDRCYMTFWVLLCSPAEVATPWVKEDVKLIFACVLRTGSLLHDTGCCHVHPPRWQPLGSSRNGQDRDGQGLWKGEHFGRVFALLLLVWDCGWLRSFWCRLVQVGVSGCLWVCEWVDGYVAKLCLCINGWVLV
jgi:hypothetical protein